MSTGPTWRETMDRLAVNRWPSLREIRSHRGIKAARSQYDAWLAIAGAADWKTPEDVKKAHPKASVLKGGRVVFNIKANDYRLIALVQYEDGVLMIRFFGSHEEYDGVDAETV
jgi:mRNA interferase HigB